MASARGGRGGAAARATAATTRRAVAVAVLGTATVVGAGRGLLVAGLGGHVLRRAGDLRGGALARTTLARATGAATATVAGPVAFRAGGVAPAAARDVGRLHGGGRLQPALDAL